VVRYSFLVRLLHPLLQAGLARRTVIAMLQHLAQQCLYVHAGAIHKVCYGGSRWN
jgi:hypothetical protein